MGAVCFHVAAWVWVVVEVAGLAGVVFVFVVGVVVWGVVGFVVVVGFGFWVMVWVMVATEGGRMTTSDQLLTALVSDSGQHLSPEEVTDWAVRYEAETGDASLRGVTVEELLLLLLPIPHQRPRSRLGSGSGPRLRSGSWSRSWSQSRSGSVE